MLEFRLLWLFLLREAQPTLDVSADPYNNSLSSGCMLPNFAGVPG